MEEDVLVAQIRKSICGDVQITQEGDNRLAIDTSFGFDDGDSYVIVFKKIGEERFFTDEGHTLMHLSYHGLDDLLYSGQRNTQFQAILDKHGMEDLDGELRLYATGEDYGLSLSTFIQGLDKITALTAVSKKDAVAAMFMDDFKKSMTQMFGDKCRFSYHDETRDLDKKYVVDCYIEAEKPILIFALVTDYKCKDAIITCMKFKEWGIPFVSIGVFQESEKINRKVQAQSMDTFDKQYSTLYSASGSLLEYMKRIAVC